MSYDIPMGMPLWPAVDRHDGQPHYLHSVAAFPGVTLAPYMLPDLKSKRLTREHTSYLESQFQACAKPNTNVKRSIAVHLGVSIEKINNWFQNRRAKHKQDLKKQAQQQQADLSAASNPNSNSGDSPQEPLPFAFTTASSTSSLPSAASSPPALEFACIKEEMSLSPTSPTMQADGATISEVSDMQIPLTPAMTPAIDTTTPITTLPMPAISLEQYNMPTVSMPMAMPSWIDAQSPDLAATLDILPPCNEGGLAISLEDQALAHAVGFATALEMDPSASDRSFHRRMSSTASLTDDSVDDMVQQSFGQLKPSAAQHSAPTLATRRRKRVPKPLNMGGRVAKCGLPSGQQSPALALGLNNWSMSHPDDLPTPLTPLSSATYHSAAASSGGLASGLGAYFPWTSPPVTPLNVEGQAFTVPLQQRQQQPPAPTPQQQQEPQQQEQQPRFYTSCAPPQSAPATQLAFPPSVMPDLPAPPPIMDSRHLRRPSLPNAPAQSSVDRGLWLEFPSPMSAMNMDIPNGFTY